jgi:hypothetical protein
MMKKALRVLGLLFVAATFSGCIFAQDFGEGADGVDPDTDAGDVSVDGMDTTDTGEDTVDPDTDTTDTDTDMDVRDTRDGDTDVPDGDTDMNDADTGDADVFDPDACDPNNPPTWYKDVDGDGYGNRRMSIDSCQRPTDENGIPYAPEYGDCNFLNSQVYPGAPEICDGDDNNCDGIDDNAADGDAFYKDVDGDGFGDPSNSMNFCSDADPRGYVENDEDCDDTTPTVGGFEDEAFFDQSGQFVDYCNDGLDNDCNQDGVDGNDPGCMDDDGDTTPNAVDPLYMIDTNSDGKNDAVCVDASETMDGAWATSDAYYQGVVSAGTSDVWGGYEQIVSSQVDAYQSSDDRWCRSLLGLNQTLNQDSDVYFRYVSTLNASGGAQVTSSCQNGWTVMDIDRYCSQFSSSDTLCSNIGGQDACGNSVGWRVKVFYDISDQEILAP